MAKKDNAKAGLSLGGGDWACSSREQQDFYLLVNDSDSFHWLV